MEIQANSKLGSCTIGHKISNFTIEVSSGTCEISLTKAECGNLSIAVFGREARVEDFSFYPSYCYHNPAMNFRYYYNERIPSETIECSQSDICICKTCVKCPVGKRSNENTTCVACDPGKYSDEVGKGVCKDCLVGTYNDELNQPICKNCKVGTFNSNTGQLSCSDCPTGTYSDEVGLGSLCKPCSAGMHNNLIGQETCKKCSIGKFSPFAEQNFCLGCPAGRFENDEGSKQCKECKAGMYNDLIAQQSCKQCDIGAYAPSSAMSSCITCPAGTFQNKKGDSICFTCPKPETCSEGQTCVFPYSGKACTKCKENYYAVDKNTCLECPESSAGSWVLVVLLIPLICGFMYSMFQYEYDLDESHESTPEDKRQDLRRQSKEQGNLFKLSVRKKTKQSFTHVPTSVAASVFVKHSLHLSFLMPLLKLIYIPENLRDLLLSFLSLITIDLSGMITSPECEWKIDIVGKYILKMFSPIIILLFFITWYFVTPYYVFYKEHYFNKKKQRNGDIDLVTELSIRTRGIRNTIVAIGSFLWLTILYPLTMFQIISAWDCTRQSDSISTLDMDPTITCSLDNGTWAALFFLSVFFFFIYCICSVVFLNVKQIRVYPWQKMPVWTDPQNCINYTHQSGACNACEHCSQRQKFSWLFRRYQADLFFWEYAVIIHKILLMGTSLFFTNRLAVSIPMLIAIDGISFCLICYYQPYLTDEEFVVICQVGRDLASIVNERKRCSKAGCGVNNALDGILYLGELFVLIAALIVYQLSLKVTINDDVVTNRTSNLFNITNTSNYNLTISSGKITANEKQMVVYPTDNGLAAFFEIVGILIYISGLLVLIISSIIACRNARKDNEETDLENGNEKRKAKRSIPQENAMYIEMGDRIKENINTMNFMRDIILNDVIDMVPTVSFIQGIVVRDIVEERFGKYVENLNQEDPERPLWKISEELNFQCV